MKRIVKRVADDFVPFIHILYYFDLLEERKGYEKAIAYEENLFDIITGNKNNEVAYLFSKFDNLFGIYDSKELTRESFREVLNIFYADRLVETKKDIADNFIFSLGPTADMFVHKEMFVGNIYTGKEFTKKIKKFKKPTAPIQ